MPVIDWLEINKGDRSKRYKNHDDFFIPIMEQMVRDYYANKADKASDAAKCSNNNKDSVL